MVNVIISFIIIKIQKVDNRILVILFHLLKKYIIVNRFIDRYALVYKISGIKQQGLWNI